MYSLTVVFALQGKNVLVFWCGLLHFWFPIYFFFGFGSERNWCSLRWQFNMWRSPHEANI